MRAATARSSHAFSRASSDAGSVIDSISSTPRGRGLSRTQQQHTLQAVASRLQHVQSSELSYPQHRLTHTQRAASAAAHWDSGDCSDTASWADEHVSWRWLVLASGSLLVWTQCMHNEWHISLLQLDWKQQHEAAISRREMESKQAFSQLLKSVQCLEDKLHEVMARQTHNSSQQLPAHKQRAHCGKHSCSSSIAEGDLIAAGAHSDAGASSVSLERAIGPESEQIAFAKKAKHIAKWVRQAEVPDPREDQGLAEPRDALAAHSLLEEQRQCSTSAAASQSIDQPVAGLTCQESSEYVRLCKGAKGDTAADQKQQQAAQTRYSRWLTAVGIVEDASEQLKVRNHNPGPGAKSVSYACLLRDCASNAAE